MTHGPVPQAERSLDADRPIERREQDKLGRRTWAEAIARRITSTPVEHGLTVAVAGEWGSGKTSVVNMVVEALKADDRATTVLNFNPWLFRGTADLVARFFAELSAQLGRDRDKTLEEVASALASLGEGLASVSSVPGMGFLARILGKCVKRWSQPGSLLERRNGLQEALRKVDSRIVVVIDDIDRLEAREVREVMRLVRLTSDLPNLLFLLAFDRERVAESLGEAGLRGQQYLDKIVQVTYELPAIRDRALREVFFDGVARLTEQRGLPEPDEEVWARVYYEIVKPLLRNLRDVKRYLNPLPETLDAIGSEVALADLLGLEALRILRPRAFEDLRAHGEFLVNSDPESLLFMSKDERAELRREELNRMLERAGDDRLLMEAVFEILFPATQDFLGRPRFDSASLGAWRRDRRVANEEVLRVYLEAGLDEGTLSSGDVDDLFSALTDERALARLIDGLDAQRFEDALERLGDYQYEYPIAAVDVAVPVLLNRMGRLSGRRPGFLRMSPRLKVPWIVLQLLRRNKGPDDLAAKAREMLNRIDRLSAWFALLQLLDSGERSGVFIEKDEHQALEALLFKRLASAGPEELADEWDLTALSVMGSVPGR